MTPPTVPLIRWFTPIERTYEEHGSLEDFWPVLGRGDRQDWQRLREEYRAVILADAGAGKTFELKVEAERLIAKGRAAFFIRIEDIGADFGNAFEVGTTAAFEEWLAGAGDAWFFLDSVDEVRLDEPRAFENAVRAFAARIHGASQRAHVYISSRPYAWRTDLDRALVETLLPFETLKSEANGEEDVAPVPVGEEPAKSALRLYRLAPLDADDVRIFAGHRGIDDVDALLAALERTALFPLARLPFDLEDILATWREDKSLASRLAVLERGIHRRLAPTGPALGGAGLRSDRAFEGAKLLAVASTLTGQANIRMPGAREAGGIEAAALLEGWRPDEVTALLARGIFTDAIYNMVRFRHREVRELLAALWFASELAKPGSRDELEGLIFREMYGETVVVPRLRPILPWLILFDEGVRARALALHPEVATEGGDAARLPLQVRRKILNDIVEGIVEQSDRGGDNSAIARIAQSDLADDTLALIDKHFSHDNAIFFLARLAWQGEMQAASERLRPIALDPGRGIYARLVSARAVASVCGDAARLTLWRDVNDLGDPLPRRLLAELVDNAPPTEETVGRLVDSIGRLEPYDRFEATGLNEAIHRLVDRLPVHGDKAPTQPLATLVEGLVGYLSREPYIERRECEVSKEYRWLMSPAMHAVERLIAGRTAASFAPAVIKIMTLLPALRFWDGSEDREHASTLGTLVPRWAALNDALFWQTVAERRLILEGKGERLDDDWHVQRLGHFWAFDAASFERTLDWVRSRAAADDRRVALALSFRTYARNERPKPWLAKLKKAVEGDVGLEAKLGQLLHPPASATAAKLRHDERRWEQRQRAREATEARHRAEFAEHLKANPDLVRAPPGLKPGEISNDQYYLLRIVEGEGRRTDRGQGGHWQALIPEFGEDVAHAYRDAATRHWRAYRPGLRSEGVDTSSIPYALIFAMAGLEIEAGEDGIGLARLAREEAALALRYSIWELNGYPRWLEPLYRAHQDLGHALIWGETLWELEHSPADGGLHYMLHDLVYYAPWLHQEIAPEIAAWLAVQDTANADCLRYARQIMVSGKMEPNALAALARSKVEATTTPEPQRPMWYALWTDTDPAAAIPTLATELASFDKAPAKHLAEAFVVSLLSGRRDGASAIGAFRTPEHLKALYVLMHQHIRVAEDIERAGKGVYSPILRDDAQDARNRLFSLLSEIPGEPTYRAMIELASEHPVADYRIHMRRNARERAVADSDLSTWTTDQVRNLMHQLVGPAA